MAAELLDGNLLKEHQTIVAMVEIYCKAHHQHQADGKLCDDCVAFTEYAHTRLDRCPYGQDKPTCNKCPVHCYKPHLREKAREIMIYAGPRMLLSHPIMALRHLWLERKPAVGKPGEGLSNRHKRNKSID